MVTPRAIATDVSMAGMCVNVKQFIAIAGVLSSLVSGLPIEGVVAVVSCTRQCRVGLRHH